MQFAAGEQGSISGFRLLISDVRFQLVFMTKVRKVAIDGDNRLFTASTDR
jgi:hypothetical protein